MNMSDFFVSHSRKSIGDMKCQFQYLMNIVFSAAKDHILGMPLGSYILHFSDIYLIIDNQF